MMYNDDPFGTNIRFDPYGQAQNWGGTVGPWAPVSNQVTQNTQPAVTAADVEAARGYVAPAPTMTNIDTGSRPVGGSSQIQPVPVNPPPATSVKTSAPPATSPANYAYGGFDFNRAQDPTTSAKDAFLAAAQAAAGSGIGMPTTKEGAEAWARANVVPALQAQGFTVHQIVGDKMFVSTRENPGGEWVDFLVNAGGAPGSMNLAWQSDGPGSLSAGPGSFGSGGGTGGGGISAWLGAGGGGATSSSGFRGLNAAGAAQADSMWATSQDLMARQNAERDRLFDMLWGRASQATNFNPTADPLIQTRMGAFRAEQDRARRELLAELAESGGPIQNMEGQRRLSSEAAGRNSAVYQGDLITNELTQRRAEIQQALQQIGGMLTADQQMNLQRELAVLNARIEQARMAAGFETTTRGQDLDWQRALLGDQLGWGQLGVQRELGMGNLLMQDPLANVLFNSAGRGF